MKRKGKKKIFVSKKKKKKRKNTRVNPSLVGGKQ